MFTGGDRPDPARCSRSRASACRRPRARRGDHRGSAGTRPIGQKMTIARGAEADCASERLSSIWHSTAGSLRRPVGLDRQPVPLEPDRALAPGWHRRDVGRSRPAGSSGSGCGRSVRAPAMTFSGGRLVQTAREKPLPPSTSSRWTSTEVAGYCSQTTRAGERSSRGCAVSRADATTMGWRIATGTRWVSRGCSTAQRRPDVWVDGHRGWLGTERQRRSRCISSKMSEQT